MMSLKVAEVAALYWVLVACGAQKTFASFPAGLLAAL